MKRKRQSVKSIMATINENGGFDNWQNWSRKQIATWVRHYFECSYSLADNVSWRLL